MVGKPAGSFAQVKIPGSSHCVLICHKITVKKKKKKEKEKPVSFKNFLVEVEKIINFI